MNNMIKRAIQKMSPVQLGYMQINIDRIAECRGNLSDKNVDLAFREAEEKTIRRLVRQCDVQVSFYEPAIYHTGTRNCFMRAEAYMSMKQLVEERRKQA